jgi:type I restriction enzyme S subunit
MAPDIILRQHDVLFMKDGAAMGKLAYIDDLPGDACLNSHILVIRPLQENYLPKFLFYVLMTDVFKAYMEQERKGTTFFGFSEQSMGNFPMSFPSLSEQKEIVSSLEDKIEKIDRLAELANKTIEHLHERRASLIAAAVSGQVKVY